MRYVLGPSLSFTVSTPPPPPPPPPNGKTDLSVGLAVVDASTVSITVPAYEPSVANSPVEIRLYGAPSGSTLPASVDEWLASSFAVSVHSIAPVPEGQTITIPVPAVTEPGAYFGQSLLGFAE